MLKKFLKKLTLFSPILLLGLIVNPIYSNPPKGKTKPRILISSDIGGTDPDDFQSMIHLLMYSDLFQIEGLVSSPFGDGRKKHFLDMIDLYEKDLSKLKEHSSDLADPNVLRAVCKQGVIDSAPFKGYNTPTEGSKWIIKCAKKKGDQPLWVLVWGGIEDLAQALHDVPEIEKNIKVYWIGGPNKKWCINAYTYIAKNHPNLWIIEANATYRDGLSIRKPRKKSAVRPIMTIISKVAVQWEKLSKIITMET